jgi:ferritin-like metal-binding protein YciE
MKKTTLQPFANDALKKEKTKSDKANNRITEGLRDLFLNGLKDMYWSEKALQRAMPKMIKNATSDTLTLALCRHLDMTDGHVTQLESVFHAIDEKAKSKKCPIMSSLIREAERTMDNTEKGIVRDAAIVCINRKMRHHEMATYSVLHSLSITLMAHDAAVLLRQSFEEEKEADEQLASIAKSFHNAEIVLTNADIAFKTVKELATNKAVLTSPNTLKSGVLHPHLSESDASEMKMIRIIEVQFYKQNGGNTMVSTQEIPATTPLSININLEAISK